MLAVSFILPQTAALLLAPAGDEGPSGAPLHLENT